MRQWAIDATNYDERTSTLAIEQSRRPSLSKGDSVVIFERKNGDILFTHSAVVGRPSFEGTAPNKVVFTANLTGVTKLSPRRRLSHFSYSLLKVYRYSKPRLHFRRQYVSLTNDDFDTIVNARVFWARTAFGTYLNELPEDAIAEFVRMVSVDDPRLLVDQGEFRTLWGHLHQFIVGQYLGAHQLTDAIADLSNRISNKVRNLEFKKLKLGDDEGTSSDQLLKDNEAKSSDLIYSQQLRLKAFANSIQMKNQPDNNLLNVLDDRIAENSATETEFEKLFRGTQWPTHLMPR